MSASGPKRTSLFALHMSAFDPKRTSASPPHTSALKNKAPKAREAAKVLEEVSDPAQTGPRWFIWWWQQDRQHLLAIYSHLAGH